MCFSMTLGLDCDYRIFVPLASEFIIHAKLTITAVHYDYLMHCRAASEYIKLVSDIYILSRACSISFSNGIKRFVTYQIGLERQLELWIINLGCKYYTFRRVKKNVFLLREGRRRGVVLTVVNAFIVQNFLMGCVC